MNNLLPASGILWSFTGNFTCATSAWVQNHALFHGNKIFCEILIKILQGIEACEIEKNPIYKISLHLRGICRIILRKHLLTLAYESPRLRDRERFHLPHAIKSNTTRLCIQRSKSQLICHSRRLLHFTCCRNSGSYSNRIPEPSFFYDAVTILLHMPYSSFHIGKTNIPINNICTKSEMWKKYHNL